MRHSVVSDDVHTIPLVQAVCSAGSIEEQTRSTRHEKIYGKASHRQAVTKLRARTFDGAHPGGNVAKWSYRTLQDVMVNRAAKIHNVVRNGFLAAASIAPEHCNVLLDVENVGGSFEAKHNTPRPVSQTDVGDTNARKHVQVTAAVSPAQDTRSPSDGGMKSDINRIRGYMDLLDEYSLHHFVIWQGKVIRDTPEFASLMRTHHADWSSIARCVATLEDIMEVNAVPLAVIDGKQLGELAKFDLERVDEADLCSCIANLEQIRPLLRHTRFIANAPSAAQLAAVTIQAAGRRFLERSGFLLLKNRRFAAVQLQRLARGRRCRKVVAALLLHRRTEVESKWLDLQKDLRIGWDHWRNNERVIIHLPSTAAGAHGPDLQRHQTPRVHWLLDPKVHVVCVSHSPPNEDVLEYHRKILEVRGIGLVRERYSVVVPENMDLFPNHASLASLLLGSPGSLRRIVQIVNGRPAIVVSDAVDWQHKRLAVTLGVPLLSAEPSLSALLQTLSGMKRVFAAADVNIPIGTHDIYDEEDLVISLTKLIACNLEVRRWYIKVDDCRGSRGLAVLDTATVACMTGLKRERAQIERANGALSGVWYHPDVQLLARARVLKTLRSGLHRSVLIYNKEVYPTWQSFMAHFARVGGVVEAEAPDHRNHPSIHIFLSPSGEISFLSETEMLFDMSHENVGSAYPQSCVSSHALRGASAAVARNLYERGVVGYLSLHFVVFWDNKAEAPRLWATGLELGLSESAFSFCLFRSLTKNAGAARDFGCYKEFSVRNRVDHTSDHEAGQRLHYVYLGHVRHPSLQSIRVSVFFKLCRLEGISFNLGTQVGTIFTLMDNLASGMVGMLTIALSKHAALEQTLGSLKFIRGMTTRICRVDFLMASSGFLVFGTYLLGIRS